MPHGNHDVAEVQKRAQYVLDFCKEIYPDSTELAMTIGTERQCLIDATALIRTLKHDAKLNAACLARQCDLARAAETKAMHMQEEVRKLIAAIQNAAQNAAIRLRDAQ